MDNEILKALGQWPELVKIVRTLIEDNDYEFAILVEAGQKKMQAEMPNSEIQKVSAAAASSVSHTRCASPDVTATINFLSAKKH